MERLGVASLATLPAGIAVPDYLDAGPRIGVVHFGVGNFHRAHQAMYLARLLHAQSLLPTGVLLLFVEGFRPPALQRTYFEEYAAELARAHPDWQAAELRDAASRFVSPPEIAPHSAGAAVDVTLIDHQGRELDMGTRVNASPEESDGACYTDAPGLSVRARTNRATLSGALSAAGLINYGTEWWHWSAGDRYWALQTQQSAALYGPVELP